MRNSAPDRFDFDVADVVDLDDIRRIQLDGRNRRCASRTSGHRGFVSADERITMLDTTTPRPSTVDRRDDTARYAPCNGSMGSSTRCRACA
jgi:hypothetical protein